MDAIKRAIDCFGSQAAMALALGVKQPTVSEWLRGERQVPAERCPVIERETKARAKEKGLEPVLCEELRPDIAWGVLREQAAPEPVAAGAVAVERAAAADTREECYRIVYGATERPHAPDSDKPSRGRSER